MPEMRQQAPSVAETGQRLRAEWLAAWIGDPRSLRPSATMPRLLHGDAATVRQQAADLATYLAGLEGKAPAPVPGGADLKEGRKLFEKLGCIGCHNLKDPKEADSYARLSLYFVGAKFQPGALEAFLAAPHAHHAWSRMPDFKLQDKEAQVLAAFLLDHAKGKVEAMAAKGDAGRGAKLFRETGCASCHVTKAGEKTLAAALPAPKGDALTRGCLSDKPTGRAPDFGLRESQRLGLRDFLATDGASLTRETPAEFSLRQVQLLQCVNCHRRDGGASRLFDVLGDEGDGTVPEAVPSLTWTGQKLKPQWTARLLSGQHDHRARSLAEAADAGLPRPGSNSWPPACRTNTVTRRPRMTARPRMPK